MKTYMTVALAITALIFSCNLQAQSIYQEGALHFKKGKTQDAYIQIDFAFPQRFQQNITYISPKDWAKASKNGKIKGSMKEKLNPKDVVGYSLKDGRYFETVKYIDISGRAVKMLPKKLSLEKVADGKIELFKYYSRTTGKISQELADKVFEDRESLIAYINDNFQLLIRKDSDNPKNINMINLLNYIGDNPRVKENYNNNHYGLRNIFSDGFKMGKYVNKEFEAAFLRMVNDYNSEAATSK